MKPSPSGDKNLAARFLPHLCGLFYAPKALSDVASPEAREPYGLRPRSLHQARTLASRETVAAN
jgi:hypothetical protein